MTAIGIRFQQFALVALAPLMAITFWSRVADPVNVPKSTLAAVVAVLVAVVSLIRTAATRRLTVPRAPAAWAAAAFGLALLVATVTSDVPGASVAGARGRSDGLILYGACVVLFLVGLRALDGKAVRLLAWGLLLGGVFAVLYGLLQKWGHDPINWASVGLSPVIGTFGNPDFESGYLGIVIPLAAWGALTRGWAVGWRVASLSLALACLLVTWWTSAVQGFVAAAAGLLVIGVALLLERAGTRAKPALLALGAAVALVVAVVVVLVVARVGPGDRLRNTGSLTTRQWYWGSALRMWKHSPVTGVGLDRYGAHYRAVRPAAAAAGANYSDAAHSVPLHLLATGGLLLAVPYAAVVLLVGWALVRGLRRTAGEDRLLLAGIGGAWVAYEVQSVVSIDQPALAVTHWLLAAAVVAASGTSQLYERLLPGAVQPRAKKGRGAQPDLPPPLVWSPATLTICAVVSAVGLVAFWFVLKPLRGSYDVRGAALSVARGEGNPALARLNAATRVASYESSYWLQRGEFFEQVKQPQLAAAAFASGVRHDPRAWDVLVAGAKLAKAMNDTATLDRYSHELEKLDPSGSWRSPVGS